MYKIFCAIGALIGIASAQGMGDGISKYTRGQSDPVSCLHFFENIMGATEAPDDCSGGKCECATQGRAQFGSGGMPPMGLQGPPPGPSGGDSFGMHAINCTYHPYGEHPLAWTEAQVDAEVGDFSKVSQHMDSNVGVMTDDLSTYLTKLENSDVKYPHLSLQYQYDDKTYYSVLAQACSGYFVEILSNNKPSQHDTSNFVKTEELRFDWSLYDFDNAESKDKVVKVSRATTKMSEMLSFYTETIGGKIVKKSADGADVEWAIVKLDSADAQLHFVNRPAADGAKFTVADLETLVNGVHDQYIKSTNCGFDQYADHHWAYDTMSGITLSSVAKKLEAGGHKYRWFSLPGSMHQIYAFDPSGWTLQLDLQPGNDVPSKCASYSAACKSDDGCYGQGLCDNLQEGQFVYENINDYRFFLQ